MVYLLDLGQERPGLFCGPRLHFQETHKIWGDSIIQEKFVRDEAYIP